MEINSRIRKLYELKNFKSQKEFSDAIGVSDKLVSNYFADKNTPSYDVLMKIITKFPDVDARWLLIGDSEKSNTLHELKIKDNHVINRISESNQEKELSLTDRVKIIEDKLKKLERKIGE
jgi:transcriptional regulator with XRE-family HTH domain